VKILFLSQRIPWPPDRGDKITTWRLIERMAREHEVRVVAFAHDEGDLRAAEALRAKGFECFAVPHADRWKRLTALPNLLGSKPLTLGVFSSRRLRAEVTRLAAWADTAYAYSSSMGAFLLPHTLPWVMHFAELDSDKWRQYAQRSSPPMSWIYAREHRTLLAFEREVAVAARTSVFCTPLEQAIFEREVPGRPSIVMRNGVDLEHFRPAPELAEPGHIVFTGVMDYLPNVDGCTWFAREILPLVRREHPRARFSIVGSRPIPAVQRLGELEAVTVTCYVPETRDWLARAAVAVAPLRMARGIQNKVLEALAMGLPTVGTPNATQGVEGVAGEHYLVADDAEDIARALSSLLTDSRRAQALGRRARSFVEDRYDWERVFEPLDALLAQVGGTDPP
jgi:sugar transferase (PEP-CTERM/EpsH1 system associated)